MKEYKYVRKDFYKNESNNGDWTGQINDFLNQYANDGWEIFKIDFLRYQGNQAMDIEVILEKNK